MVKKFWIISLSFIILFSSLFVPRTKANPLLIAGVEVDAAAFITAATTLIGVYALNQTGLISDQQMNTTATWAQNLYNSASQPIKDAWHTAAGWITGNTTDRYGITVPNSVRQYILANLPQQTTGNLFDFKLQTGSTDFASTVKTITGTGPDGVALKTTMLNTSTGTLTSMYVKSLSSTYSGSNNSFTMTAHYEGGNDFTTLDTYIPSNFGWYTGFTPHQMTASDLIKEFNHYLKQLNLTNIVHTPALSYGFQTSGTIFIPGIEDTTHSVPVSDYFPTTVAIPSPKINAGSFEMPKIGADVIVQGDGTKKKVPYVGYPAPDVITPTLDDLKPLADTTGAISSTTSNTNVLTADIANTLDGIRTDINNPARTDPASQASRFKALVTTKFPFSLPFDFFNLLGLINATPIRPEIHVNKEIAGMPFKFDVTMEYLDPYINWFRGFVIVGFCFALLGMTRRLMGGAT